MKRHTIALIVAFISLTGFSVTEAVMNEGSVARKCEVTLSQGQTWADAVFLMAGKEYKFSASGDSGVKSIGLFIMSMMKGMQGEENMIGSPMDKKHMGGGMMGENMIGSPKDSGHMGGMMGGGMMYHKEGAVLMQTSGDKPALCFTPEKDGHYKIKAVLEMLDPSVNTGKVTAEFKQGCDQGGFKLF